MSPRAAQSRAMVVFLVRESVDTWKPLSVFGEELVSREPVLEQPVIAAGAAPAGCLEGHRDRVPRDDDEAGGREERMEEAGANEVWRGYLE